MVDRALFLNWNEGLIPQTIEARAISPYWNVGAEAIAVISRAEFVFYNIGAEATIVIARGLIPNWNEGISSVLAARGLFEYVTVVIRLGQDDPLEIQLIQADIITIERILRGK